MMKKFTLLLILLTGFAGFSQTVLEGFETSLPTSALTGDAGVAISVVPDPETDGTHGQVLKVESSITYVNDDGETKNSEVYQNAQYIFQNGGIDMSTTEKTLKIDVYSDVATDVLAKLESGTGGASNSQVDTSIPHTGNGWETLSFNFSNGVAQNNTSNPANGVYGKLILFPLWGGDDFNAASETTTYYDNISGLAYVPPAQSITVSVDHSTFLTNLNPGVTIRVYNTELDENGDIIGFQEFLTIEDTEDPNIHSYTFPEGVTSATYFWRVYGSDTGTDENLVSLILGGGVENNLGETSVLGDNNGIDTDYADYCNRTVTSTSGNYEAPTTYFNSLQKVGVEYTELVLTADAGNYVLDYSINEFNENHGPGATDNGDGTYTVILDPSSAFQYKWNNLTTSTQEDLSSCIDGVGIANDGTNSYRTHTAGENKADTFNVCPSNAQTITVSVDVSEFVGDPGVNIAVYDGTIFQEYSTTADTTNPNKYSYTFADGVTTATYYWVTYTGPPPGVGETLVSLVGGGGIEDNLAATLGANNGIDSNFFSYCNRTVTSLSGVYVAPTFYHNSFRQVGVTYTELVLTAASGDDVVIDYSLNEFVETHGPGATDNGDDTYTVIVDPSSTFTYLWYNKTTSTQEDLSACSPANRNHTAGENRIDSFGVCQVIDPEPTTAATTPPTRDAADVISLYGDAYGTALGLAGVTWDNGAEAAEGSYAGNNALKIVNGTGDFAGFDIVGGVDATEMTHVHADFWVAGSYVAGQVVKIKLSNHDETTEINTIIKEVAPSANDEQTWISIDAELGDAPRANIKQILLIYTNSAGAPDIVYADNIYMYKQGVAYDLPFDFETSPVTADWTGFAGAGITVVDLAAPQTVGNTSTKLAKIVRDGGETYAGVTTTVDTPLDFSTKSTITARIWTSAPIGTPILMKTEEVGNDKNISEKIVSTTKTGEWEDLVFNFAGITNANQRKLVIIPNLGTLGDGTDASTYYIDDIVQAVSTLVDPEPTTAATTPSTRDAADVISLYGDAYGTALGLAGVTWDNGAEAAEGSYAGNNALKIVNGTGDFAGFDIVGGVDATEMTHVHADFWVAGSYVAGQVVKIKLSNHDETTEINTIIKEVAPSANDEQTWISIDAELGDAARANIKQILLIYPNSAGAPDIVYADNIYFYNDANLGLDSSNAFSMSLYPSPAKNELKISAENKIDTASIYNILGRKVKSFSVNAKTSSLDVSSLSTGIYILKYTSNNVVGSMKFIKE